MDDPEVGVRRDVTRRRSSGWCAASLVAVALAAAACSSGSGSGPTTTTLGLGLPTTSIPAVSRDGSIAAVVPPAVAATGRLTVGTDPDSPPDEFLAPGGHTIVGMDVDLATAIGQVLGLKTTLVTTSRSTITGGVTGGRYDLGMSTVSDTVAQQGPVDFVDYFLAGQGFFVRSGSGRIYMGLASLCGARVAVERGSVEQADVTAESASCTQSGKGAARVVVTSGLAGSAAAVSSGTAQVAFVTSQAADFVVGQSDGRIAAGGQPIGLAPLGIVASASGGLAQPVASAVNTLISNGTYAAILSKWGVQSGAVPAATINGVTH